MPKSAFRRTSRILAIDLIVLALCAAGVYRLSQKAAIETLIEKQGSALVVISSPLASVSPLKYHDSILSVSGHVVTSSDQIEFLCDEHAIAEKIPITVHRNGSDTSLSVALIRDYSITSIVVESLAAFIFFVTGIAVLLLQSKDKAARIFHHLCVAIAALIVLTTGRFTVFPFGLSYAIEVVFQCFYVLVPVLFLHFALVFPKEQWKLRVTILRVAYSLGAIIALWSAVAFLRAAYPAVTLAYYASYDASHYATLIFFAGLFIAGFAILLRSYRQARDAFEIRKFRWIFFGTVTGTGVYFLLQLLPELIVGKPVDEQYAILGSIIAPVSFAFAIIRFKVFDIDLFFKRSTVYTLVLILLLGFYLALVWLFTQVVFAFNLPSALPNILGALFIALLFDPLRRRVQGFVDKRFFRVSYNFYEAQRSIIEEIKFATERSGLASIVTERIQAVLPATKIGFFVVEPPSDRLRLIAHRHFDLLERFKVQLVKSDLKTGLELPVVLDELIEPGIDFESADPVVFNRWGIALVLPMLSSNRTILGFLVLGEKLSEARFMLEDISLLTSVTAQTGLALERLDAVEALLIEQLESERLGELSRLKSYFVSSVSHDLKTPLTSIRLFAELLRDNEDVSRPKIVEYLGIIEGEADRLSRLITNVLDFATIEKGTKRYSFKLCDLNEIARDVLRSLNYQITSNGFGVVTNVSAEPLQIEADPDAVFDAMTNLISNAMKYSPPDRKEIIVATMKVDYEAVLSVQDQGYGIAPEEIEHIFESFYRIDDSTMKSAGGAGIGLALVKYTMEAHRGSVEVSSEQGEGSIFALHFPLSPSTIIVQ